MILLLLEILICNMIVYSVPYTYIKSIFIYFTGGQIFKKWPQFDVYCCFQTIRNQSKKKLETLTSNVKYMRTLFGNKKFRNFQVIRKLQLRNLNSRIWRETF